MTASRLLLRLDAEIASAPTLLESDCKRAERAAYLARLGRFDEARAAMAELQGRYGATPHVEISIAMNLAEGLISFFDNLGADDTDKVQRAHALSVASGRQQSRAICAAWLAHWAYSRLDMVTLAEHVREALTHADDANHAARARACLVAAQALHLAGRLDLAKPWYDRSRICATDRGDDVTVRAILHNMAWLRMLMFRQAVLTGDGQAHAGRHALLSAESAESLDLLAGDTSWSELKPMLKAQIASLHGDADEALALYRRHLPAAREPSRLQANLLADKAWCHARLGQRDDALQAADASLNSLADDTQIDDRAATHSRLAQAFDILEDARKEAQMLAATQAWRQFSVLQQQAVDLLAGLDERGAAQRV